MGDAARCAQCGGEIAADAPLGACPRCALAAALPAARPDPTPEEVAAKLPAFDILGVLGRGGMGVVFKARQKALDRVVALKVLPPATAATPGFSERFVREAKAMARLAHPNIVAVHDFGEAGGLFYLVLEFVDGMNVREAMRAGRIGPAEALAIVPQICDALQYAHDRGVVHRDVKPENVLIDRDGRVKIADFGLAKLADREAGDLSLTGASQVMGTLHYMAPEQWERPKEVDHRCDIYSLGVVFYEMLTGELPVGKFEPPSHRAAIDVRIDSVVMRSLERNREQRWQRADEVKTGVSAITSSPNAAPARQPAPVSAALSDEEPKTTFETVAYLLVIAVGAAVVAVAADVPWMWWGAGVTLLGAAIVTVQVVSRRARLAASKPETEKPEEEKQEDETLVDAAGWAVLAVAFGVGALWVPALWWACGTMGLWAVWSAVEALGKPKVAAGGLPPALPPPPPPAVWLSPLMCGVAAVAVIVLIASMFWSVGARPLDVGNATGSLSIVLGIALGVVLAVRRSQATAAEKAGRGPLGPPVLIGVVSAASVLLGVFCLLYALLGNRSNPSPPDGATPSEARAASERAQARKSAESRGDSAPWEFEIEVPAGEDPAHKPSADDRQGIWSMWGKAQALQGGQWSNALGELYPIDDSAVLQSMSDEKRAEAVAQRAIGPLFLPKSEADLSKFRIERVRLVGWSPKGHFTTAAVHATDGAKTLRFSMRFANQHQNWAESWLFAIAPLELK